MVHAPALHFAVALALAQALPHEPQFVSSVAVSAQWNDASPSTHVVSAPHPPASLGELFWSLPTSENPQLAASSAVVMLTASVIARVSDFMLLEPPAAGAGRSSL
jgi:hypothetical protein